MGRILHALSLNKVGGVEAVFDAYLASPQARHHEHHVLLLSGAPHGHYSATVEAHAASVHSVQHWHGLRLPKFLRSPMTRTYLRSLRPEVVVIYNWLVQRAAWQAKAVTGARLVYYERGAAWQREEPRDVIRRNLDSTDQILCNSNAAARVLALKFDVPRERCRTIYNPLRLTTHAPRSPRADGVFRMGMAGRMVPVKGMATGLHALRMLLDRGTPAHLAIAGAGPEGKMLRDTAQRLGLGDAVTFCGVVRDMAAFYGGLDAFLCPSLREPLGNVAIEAGAAGCPVVASAVDGLPEVVEHDVTGICLRPTLPAADYFRLGVQRQELPTSVYDPGTDSLRTPMAVDPASLADAVTGLVADRDRHLRMSSAAVLRSRTRFSMERYMTEVDEALAALA